MKHGLTGYVRHKCRCETCSAAARASRRKSDEKNQEKRSASKAAYAKTHQAETKARVAKWVAENPDRAREQARKRVKRYQDAHREATRERYHDWLERNPDKAKAASDAYRKAHPEKSRESASKRRDRAASAETLTISDRDWHRLCARHGNLCAYCGASGDLTIDHIVPVVRGGRHSIGNVLPACRPCNSSKRNRLLVEWRNSWGRGSTTRLDLVSLT